MTLKNVDYNSLITEHEVCTDFKNQVKEAILLEAGSGVTRENVHLALTDGSVKVVAVIDSLTGDMANVVHRSLNSSMTLGRRVVSNVCSIRGVEKVSTGEIVVSDIGVGAPGERFGASTNWLSWSRCLCIGAILAIVVLVVAITLKRQKLVGGAEHSLVHSKHGEEPSLPNGNNTYTRLGMSGAQTDSQSRKHDPNIASMWTDAHQPQTQSSIDGVSVLVAPAVHTQGTNVGTLSAEDAEQDFIAIAADMGFTEEQARAALADAGGNCEIAYDLLLAMH